MLPYEFTATTAATLIPEFKVIQAQPIPPFFLLVEPFVLATVAPVPAPTAPVVRGSFDAALQAITP